MNTPRIRVFIPLALLVQLSLPLGARAQTGEVQRARTLFEQGVAHAQAARWEPALRAFRASRALVDRTRTVFNIAVALDRLGRGSACMEVVDNLLARGDVNADDREAAQALRRRWLPRLAIVDFELTPANATVAVDGRARAGAGSRRRVYVSPGRHSITITSSARRPSSFTLRLAPGERIARRVDLTADGAVSGGTELQTRDIDRATVRLLALRGVVQQASGPERWRPLVGLGNGLVIGTEGWILTAESAVRGADLLAVMIPGERTARSGRVVYVRPDQDLAVVQVQHPIDHGVSLRLPGALSRTEPVSVTSYSEDFGRRHPDVSSGVITNARSDGRIEISIALSEAAVGAPVTTVDGAVAGMVSAPSVGDAGGGRGLAYIEPLDRFISGWRPGSQAPFVPHPGEDSAAEAFVAWLGIRPDRPPRERLDRLEAHSRETLSIPIAALLAVEADRLSAMLSAQRAREARQQRRSARTLARSFASRLDQEHGQLASRYAAVRAGLPESDAIRRWRCRPDGRCGRDNAAPPADFDDAPLPDSASRPWIFEIALGLGPLFDDPDQSAVGGFGGSVHTTLLFGHWGVLDPFRFNFVANAQLSAGGWRGDGLLDVLAHLGARLDVGSADFAVSAEIAYGVGVVVAENRTNGVFISYRTRLGVLVDTWGVGLEYQEVGRGANSTLRRLQIYGSIGIR